MITVLAGGVGAARFLRGLVSAVDPASITVVVNTGDDSVINGLHVSPDLDTVTYTVAGAIDLERGWGLADESWRTMKALGRYTDVRPTDSVAANTWFNLGDQDIATHLYRTARLAEGATLSEVTDEIRRAWGLPFRILPMTDDPVATRVDVVEGDSITDVGFQEYFVQRRHSVPVTAVRFVGAESARPTFLDELSTSDVVVVAPSNPLVSIGPLRALEGVDRTLNSRRDHVVAVSPIVAGSALKGPADRMLAELGHEPSVVGVARLYAPVCSTLVIDVRDADRVDEVEREGVRCVVTDTIMSSPDVSRSLALTTVSAITERNP
ncbi:MAG: 2-phopspho-L-lactate transferase [Actinomycetota bacterium]|jgi:LPPG:FO 2-phospho-L-lactate transferase